jgi:hypothetical protein
MRKKLYISQQIRAVYLDRYKLESTAEVTQLALECVVAFMWLWHFLQELVHLCTGGLFKSAATFPPHTHPRPAFPPTLTYTLGLYRLNFKMFK